MKTKPRIIEFNGAGRSHDPEAVSGFICILVQGDSLSVVQVEIVPDESHGPWLHHATNGRELDSLVSSYWDEVDHTLLSTDRHWLIACPQKIASVARFSSAT